MISAVILAAGKSTRMGELKPLIKIKGKTFLRHIIDEICAAGVEDIVIVVGYNAELVIKHSGVTIARFVENADYEKGQFSSLQAGIRVVDKKADYVVVCLGDQPQVKAAWLLRLVHEAKVHKSPITVPAYHGRSGHPVVYSAKVCAQIRSMLPQQSARDLMHMNRDKILRVAIEDEGILFDADTPEDLPILKNRMH